MVLSDATIINATMIVIKDSRGINYDQELSIEQEALDSNAGKQLP
jgi:hypothetical protein